MSDADLEALQRLIDEEAARRSAAGVRLDPVVQVAQLTEQLAVTSTLLLDVAEALGCDPEDAPAVVRALVRRLGR